MQYKYLVIKLRRFTFLQLICVLCLTSNLPAKTVKAQDVLQIKVSVNQKNIELESVFNKLQQTYSVNFVYSPQMINSKQRVNVYSNNLPLSELLSQVLTPLGLSYEAKGDVIAITRKTADLPAKETAVYQTPIRGVVKGSDGKGLGGATVRVKDGDAASTTDESGRFTIAALVGQTLVVSFVGYTPQEVQVTNTQELSISLAYIDSKLEDVVVVGYGTMKKRDLTGSVLQLRPDDVANDNPKTVQDILRGAPGIRVGYDPTAKGGGSIQIRGQRSVYTEGGHNDPLIVLDGMFFYGQLSEINPDDIAQIDVLKDASAAAVYGSRAANGVIIINTKQGKRGKPVITTTMNFGATEMADYRKRFDPQTYLKHRQDWYEKNTYGVNASTGAYETYQTGVYTNRPGYFSNPSQLPANVTMDQWRGYTTNETGETDESIWVKRLGFAGNALQNFRNGKTVDWADLSLRTGYNQDYNTSISGAGDRVNYYFSMGYLKNQGAIVNDDYRAVRSNLKVNARITDWFEVGANINFQDRSDGNIDNDLAQALRNSPYADYADEHGNPVQFPLSTQYSQRGYNFDFQKQYLALEKGFTVLNTIVNAKVKLPFGVSYTLNAAPRYEFFYDRYFSSASLPGSDPATRGVNREQERRFNWTLNNTISWDKTFAQDHHVIVTLVQEAEEIRSWEDRIEARRILPSDTLGFHNTRNGTKENSNFWSNDSRQTADGMLARLFYSYDNRYMITGSIRRDGYSAFGAKNPYATFPSLALAWTFTNEHFFPWSDIMSNGKLRVSYGKNGNRSLENPYLALANLSVGAGKTQGYLTTAGQLAQLRYLIIERMANPDLQWEKTASWNVGLDFGFLNDRISGSLEYYSMQTNDMIMEERLPSYTGFSFITTNLGQVDNKGIELALNTVNVRNNIFQWTTSLGFSYNRNRIKHLYYQFENVVDANGNVIGTKESNDISNGWFIGQSIGELWDYRVTGIWQTNEVEEAKKYGQAPGDPKVENSYTADDVKNANGTVTPVYNNNDKQFLGRQQAPIHWSIRNDFTLWKDLTLSVNIYSYMGHKIMSGNYLNNDDDGGRMNFGLANLYAKEYWTPDNPTNKFGRIEAKGPVGAAGVGKVYDRSFIRLENISLGYTLPGHLTSRFMLNRVRVSASVRNVATWKKEWPYGDPEVAEDFRAGLGAWSTRVYNLGLNVIF